MLTSLIGPVVGILVAESTTIALKSAAKMIIPIGLKATTGFAVQVGVSIGAGLIAGKIADVAVKNIESMLAVVNPEATEDPEQVEN